MKRVFAYLMIFLVIFSISFRVEAKTLRDLKNELAAYEKEMNQAKNKKKMTQSEINNINSRESLKNLKESLESLNDIESIPKILIENKCDLLGAEDSYNNGTKFLKESMKKLGCLNCFRTSALNGYNCFFTNNK